VEAVSDLHPLAAALLVAVVMSASWLVAWEWARRRRLDRRAILEGPVEEAALALLGLLLAFTFSMALNKYERRREALITDSNAIGDFYTCATLLPEPVRGRLQEVIRDYTQLRLEAARTGSISEARDALTRFPQMHGRMTDLVGEAIAAGTPIAVPLTQTLNALTSSHASRLAAASDRLPATTLLLLLFSAGVVSALVGRDQGTSSGASLAGTAVFILIIALTVSVTLDLNNPSKGLIRVSQQPIKRLLETMGGQK
jgi:hypothetical protein